MTIARASGTPDVYQQLALLKAEYAELLGSARAAVAAARCGELDPVAYLAGLLDEHGQLPPDDMTPRTCQAQALAASIDAYGIAEGEPR